MMIGVATLCLGACDEQQPDDSDAAVVEAEPAVPTAKPQPQPQFVDYVILPAVTVVSVGEVECAPADVFFATDSATLDEPAKAALDRVAACLQDTPSEEPVEVTATADPRGTEPYNETLSRDRAKAVAEYLSSKGVEDGAFEIRARGEKGVIEDIPALWPLQRAATVDPKPTQL